MKLTEVKRKDILDAAIREFQEQGFAAARVNRIAEMAEVSKRTLYKHFESKELLFSAITDILLDQMAAMPSLHHDPTRPVRDQLVQALRDYVTHLTGDRYMALNRLVLSEFLRDQGLARAFFERAALQDAPIARLIDEAMQAGALRRADAPFAANQLLSMVKHFLVWPRFLMGAEPDGDADAVIADCVEMFMGRYGSG
ncbi:TetR/AcrR family transcriptional regulator [Paracoccus sp. 1_MG-2023]|uniref:TetR/AcrR family transcriptional regulator n=1 Tax=unclassified Paracoccus (in: a-proteobacteria) TaxID=2688777 RepID=UPI001C08C387|nr:MULTISPECIES: TetR/AcrR family transcriptional regulator [unclassified Paracoccus (in: a-proteobacteria)]MBU2957903.1 TetR/AcrR family transcriptional regulator [Paracoccus sp. C2R09]MDO6668904.1 TetR/AcrR family transcriptional regulator [Paracoccus sp. 1_MG-2023]